MNIPDYTFNISPGLNVKNAFMTNDSISKDESVFSSSQKVLLNRILNTEIAKLEEEFSVKLEEEKQISWQEGNEAGINKTTELLVNKVETVINELNNLMESITKHKSSFFEFYEQEIISLVVKIAKKVIDVEIKMDPEIILFNLKKSLEFLNEKEEIKILVNPLDWEKVSENIKKLSLSLSLPENIEIIALESITQGGCKIDFKAGSIDADIETQFAEIERKLLKNV